MKINHCTFPIGNRRWIFFGCWIWRTAGALAGWRPMFSTALLTPFRLLNATEGMRWLRDSYLAATGGQSVR